MQNRMLIVLQIGKRQPKLIERDLDCRVLIKVIKKYLKAIKNYFNQQPRKNMFTFHVFEVLAYEVMYSKKFNVKTNSSEFAQFRYKNCDIFSYSVIIYI